MVHAIAHLHSLASLLAQNLAERSAAPSVGFGEESRISPRTFIKVGIVVVSLLVAVAIDWLAPWPYVMTLLYAGVMVLAGLFFPPRWVALTGAVCFFINLGSTIIQGPPPLIAALYSIGLFNVVALALLASWQRRQIRRHIQNAEEARQQLQLLLGMVSHDIRNPTTAILGVLQLIQRRLQAGQVDQLQAYLKTLNDAAQRIRRLTGDLLDVTSMSTGHFTLILERTDLVSMLRRVVAIQQATTGKHRVHLEAPDHLWGIWDPQRLEQVTANLVGNAIKYSPSGGDVRVMAWQEEGAVAFAVTDQGPGIAPEKQAHLFDMFARGDQGAATVGLGLGLAIAKNIVEQHGGTIQIESRLGEGSRFVVRLPVAQPGTLSAALVQGSADSG
ncbi:MAG: HAMP domain-containing sensor histidine kinase [Chloroflexi bacterium]|nr:HAMP domain-containing sensor histidine kinase [Chloroflexota bacterium]